MFLYENNSLGFSNNITTVSKSPTSDLTARNSLIIIIINQTDHHLDHNRPDIVILEKASRVCQIIDMACSFDTRVVEKEREKIDHYQEFKVEIQKMWNCKSISVVPIVIGALGQ